MLKKFEKGDSIYDVKEFRQVCKKKECTNVKPSEEENNIKIFEIKHQKLVDVYVKINQVWRFTDVIGRSP